MSKGLYVAATITSIAATTAIMGCARDRLAGGLGEATLTSALAPRVSGRTASVAGDEAGDRQKARTATTLAALRSTMGASRVSDARGDADRLLAAAPAGPCPPDMASIDGQFCVDKFEASVVEVLPNGEERPWAHNLPVDGHVVRAVSVRGATPQTYISEVQAADACRLSAKRLCKPKEWRKACRGPEDSQFGYGNQAEPRRCNDHGISPMMRTHGSFVGKDQREYWGWSSMNDPSLAALPDTVAASGSHEGCTNGYGVYDMVGNVHEWVDDPKGTFRGGYYLDTHKNGDGCGYRTDAHEASYHDYSTGFRCCADANEP